jgi:hypothetical protein
MRADFLADGEKEKSPSTASRNDSSDEFAGVVVLHGIDLLFAPALQFGSQGNVDADPQTQPETLSEFEVCSRGPPHSGSG